MRPLLPSTVLPLRGPESSITYMPDGGQRSEMAAVKSAKCIIVGSHDAVLDT